MVRFKQPTPFQVGHIPTGIDLRCRARESRASEGRDTATFRQSFLGLKLANTQCAVPGIDRAPRTLRESSCLLKLPSLRYEGRRHYRTSTTSRISFDLGRRGVPISDHQPVRHSGP